MRKWKMVEYTLRRPVGLHCTIISVMIEGKRSPERSRNMFIGQIKKNARAESHRALKKIASDGWKWRRGAVNQSTGWTKYK